LFFVWYLYQLDYIAFVNIQFKWGYMLGSILFLFAGFVISGLSWGYALGIQGYPVSKSLAVMSHGISVFAKYIPGKVWVILGRASYVSGEKIPLKNASMVSLKEQLIYLLWGLLLSCLPVFLFVGNNVFGLIILASASGISFVLFSPWFHRLMLRILGMIIKKNFDIPLLKVSEALEISKYIVVYWLCWTIAFYLLLMSAFADDTVWLMAFAFPVSVTYGVLAILMPGGIGVREGILTAFLIAGGMAIENAVTISVISRIWFIVGELFIFLLSFYLKISGKVADYPEYPSTLQKAMPETH
jgi:glycosyltransferase 2 family protein